MSGESTAVWDRLLSRQLAEATRIASEIDDDAAAALAAIVRSHVTFTLDQRDYLATWRGEFRNLPTENAWRLRRLQRLYVEEWAQVVSALRSDLSDAEARAAVHAALAVLHSATEHRSGLSPDALADLLVSMALAALHGVGPEPRPLAIAEPRRTVMPC